MIQNRPGVLPLIFGGLLPIVAFTLIEDRYGPLYGLIAAMLFGMGEILYEKIRFKQVSKITWAGNGLIMGLGLISIGTQEGIWFKLQPALLEFIFAWILWITSLLRKPLLVELSKKQNPDLPEKALRFLAGVNWRCGFFFFIHSAIATWAALEWSTQAWAVLKGLGVTLSFVLYLIAEVFVFRLKRNS